ncbi:MAG: class I SAM-dependent methyltransferase [Chloroflexota bacterium]|nr:class I SAM-dependent methyltransferase [Chloroflexota bacterium]MDE2968617.1 class I SAM-dependent methyltransferase [Chloroflexota bacterium]
MDSVIDAWRERILAHERDASAFRGAGHGHGHGHGGHGHGGDGGHVPGGHGGFTYSNRPQDPFRIDDPVLNALYAALPSGGTVLDVGGGAGRYALPLATRARHVTVVEPSEDSCEALQSRAADAGLANITVINESWEDAEAPSADMVLCSLVLHHVPDAAPFVARMQEHATASVVVVEMMETPGALEIPFYERVHGTAPTPLPGLPDVLSLLWAMDIYPDVSMLASETAVIDTDRHAAMEQLRRRLAVEEGTEADERLRAAADELLEETPEGFIVRGVRPRRTAIVTWRPTQNGA